MVVLSRTDANKWGHALEAARAVLSGAIAPRKNDPDDEHKHTLRQVQRHLDRNKREQLCHEYQDGRSTYQLAMKWGIHRQTVAAILKRHGIEQRVHGRSPLSEAELSEALALHADGWSINALGRRYGISPKTMKKRLG